MVVNEDRIGKVMHDVKDNHEGDAFCFQVNPSVYARDDGYCKHELWKSDPVSAAENVE